MHGEHQTRSWIELDEYCRVLLSCLASVDLTCKRKSKTQAAKELETDADVLAARLKKLERLLGVGKGGIINSRGSIEPTAIGEEVCHLWSKIEPLLENFRKKVDLIKNKRELRVAIIQSVFDSDHEWIRNEAKTWLPETDIVLEAVVPGSADEIIPKLLAHEIDVSIGYPPAEELNESLEERAWRPQEELVLVLWKGRVQGALQKNPRLVIDGASPKDISLMHSSFCLMKPHQPLRILVMRYLKRHRIEVNEIQRKSAREAMELVLNDDAISILPRASAQRALERKNVEVFRLKEPLYRTIVTLTSRKNLKYKEISVFREMLGKHG